VNRLYQAVCTAPAGYKPAALTPSLDCVQELQECHDTILVKADLYVAYNSSIAPGKALFCSRENRNKQLNIQHVR